MSYNELRIRHPKSIGSFITQCSDAPFSSQEKADDVKLEAKVSSRECQVATKKEAVSRDQVLKVQSCFCWFDGLCTCIEDGGYHPISHISISINGVQKSTR